MKRTVARLTDLADGQSGIVVDVAPSVVRDRGEGADRGRYGRSWGCVQRLMDLGLTPGAKLTVVKSAPFNGPVEILVRGCRIALGRGIASRIAVEVTG